MFARSSMAYSVGEGLTITRGGPPGNMPPRSGDGVTFPAERIAFTSLKTADVSGSPGGQSRSGDVQPCQYTCVEVPNDALFMHRSACALPARAALRSAKKRAATDGENVNDLGDAAVSVWF